MAVKLWSNRIEQFVDGTGVPRSGAKLFTYVGGSVNTKQTTYTESTGSTPNTNPIVLDSSGRIPQPIWLTTGVSYKFVLAPPTDTDPPTSPIDTLDVITGINDSTSAQSEWVAGPAPTFVSATQFTLVGDQTTNFHLGRRVKATVTAGTSYGTITASAFGAVTTVTVDTTGSNPLDSGLSAIAYGLLAAVNFSQSIGLDAVTRVSAAIASAATINLNAAGGDEVHITGTTGPITAITLAQGHERTVIFDSTPTLTNGASLVLRNGISRIAVANEATVFRGEAAGVVREVGPGATKQPTRTVQTSGSGATYTTPIGATRINVRMVGGGGGGGGGGAGAGTGGTGGSTSFSTITAGGGLGGGAATASGGAGGTASGGDFNITGNTGGFGPAVGNQVGLNGGPGPWGGAGAGGAASAAGGNGATNSGGGGGGAGGAAGTAEGGGGGGGAFSEKLITSPAATYTYTVGAGGTAGAGTPTGGVGGSGLIVIDESYN